MHLMSTTAWRSLIFSLPLCLAMLDPRLGLAADEGEIPPPKDEPRVIDPGPPPSDAIVLFDGKDLSKWRSEKDGGPARWELNESVATVNGTGSIRTQDGFGDCPLHVEWAAPAAVKA